MEAEAQYAIQSLSHWGSLGSLISKRRDLYQISLVAQTVKSLSAMQETQVRSLGWEDPLEKEMAVHSSTLAWRIPWTAKPGRLQSTGLPSCVHSWTQLE